MRQIYDSSDGSLLGVLKNSLSRINNANTMAIFTLVSIIFLVCELSMVYSVAPNLLDGRMTNAVALFHLSNLAIFFILQTLYLCIDRKKVISNAGNERVETLSMGLQNHPSISAFRLYEILMDYSKIKDQASKEYAINTYFSILYHEWDKLSRSGQAVEEVFQEAIKSCNEYSAGNSRQNSEQYDHIKEYYKISR